MLKKAFREEKVMKRVIALILSASMVFALAGCAKETEETKKKKKTKKTEKTEDTEDTDETDDTETSEEGSESTTDESETEESTDPTSVVYTSDLVIRHDLESLGVITYDNFWQYGAVDPTINREYGYVQYVSVDVPGFTTETGSQQVNDDIKEFMDIFIDSGVDIYNMEKEEFIEAVGKGGKLPYYHAWGENEIYRVDNEVVSFAMHLRESADDMDASEAYICYNYDVNTGLPIPFYDVVNDLDALEAYMTEYFTDLGLEYLLETAFEELEESPDLYYALMYDAIVIEGVKLPVIGHEEIFNMQYFGATPEEYSLLLDETNSLIWDFDDDGTLEELRCTYQNSELVISYKGQDYRFTENEIRGIGGLDDIAFNSDSVVLFTKNGNAHLLLSMNVSDSFTTVFYFTLDDTEVDCMWEEYGALDYGDYLLPRRMAGHFDCDVLCGESYKLMTMVFNTPLEAFGYFHSAPFELKIDVTGEQYDWYSGDVIGDYTIPAGSILCFVAYSRGNGELVVRVQDPEGDEENTRYVKLSTDGTTTIAGYTVSELFADQLYVGG